MARKYLVYMFWNVQTWNIILQFLLNIINRLHIVFLNFGSLFDEYNMLGKINQRSDFKENRQLSY